MNMKTFGSYILISIALVLSLACGKEQNIEGYLINIPSATFESIESGDSLRQSYKILIRQRLDHFGTDTSTFIQKIYLSHIDFSKPVVIVTEGYHANRNRIYEPTQIIGANQVIVEHRFFGGSVPDSLQWEYLNIRQAAADHHHIIQTFKTIYKTKFLTTGISKGGQTTMYHKYFYPDDADASLAYVAPLNFDKEEPRVFGFLENVGPDTCRQKVLDFQKLLLKNKKKLLPIFDNHAKNNNLTFKMGIEEAFEYCVLEFSFAFWQWGDLHCDSIPGNAKDLDAVFAAFEKVGFSFFAEEEIEKIRPFFYQALTEIGFYTYDIKPFGNLIEKVKNPGFGFTMPQGADTIYNYQIMKDVNHFLQTKGNNIIYIYGEYDPWSASAIELIPGKTNALKMVKKAGDHKTRIHSFDGLEKEQIYSTLEKWLEIKIER
jgi:hypothetical protein